MSHLCNVSVIGSRSYAPCRCFCHHDQARVSWNHRLRRQALAYSRASPVSFTASMIGRAMTEMMFRHPFPVSRCVGRGMSHDVANGICRQNYIHQNTVVPEAAFCWNYVIVTNRFNGNHRSTFPRYARDTIFQYNIHCQSDCVCVDNKVSDWLFVVSVRNNIASLSVCSCLSTVT